MPRPTTKTDLIKAADEGWSKLWATIDTMPDVARDKEFCFDASYTEAHWARDRNLRDVLVHLYEWHRLLLSWVGANLAGRPQPFLPAPYTWKTYGDMNVGVWKAHQGTPYDEAVRLVRGSHAEGLKLIGGFSDEELFEKAHFGWTGTTSLGSYCISATSAHYDWALKKLKAHIKLCK
jgi:hypothetical protein